MNKFRLHGSLNLMVLLITVSMSSPLFAQRETIDRIIVVVGDEVILASEVGSQLQMYALQTGRQLRSEDEIKQIQAMIIEEMISDRLFLLAAREDTSLSVRDEEIERALDEQVANIGRNFSTHDEFLAALAAEGLTLRELKKRNRQDIENQLLKQRYIQQKLSSVSISRHEVEEFYNQFKDSIPSQPEAIRLAHLLMEFEPSSAVEDSVRQLAERLRKQVLDGADLATLSTQHSSFGAGAGGGDLGYLSADDVVPEFARAAFNLAVGDISGIVRTQFGFHIIKCEGIKQERHRFRHILLGVVPSADDSLNTWKRADSLMNEIKSGADFAVLAKEHSVDNNSRAQGGELGWIALKDMPPEIAPHVVDWQTAGDLRGPVATKSGLHLFKLLDYVAEKAYSLEEDFDRIKEMARQDKTGKLADEWIGELKTKTYIDYRTDIDEN